jgi:hypothetical protein
MEPRLALLLMRAGMFLIILGAIIFFLTGDHYQPIVTHMLIWGCGSALAIFYAGTSAINALSNRVRELEDRKKVVYSVNSLADNLQEIHSLLK